MTDRNHKQDPLHGKTLKMIVTSLHETYGWQELANRIKIKCFTIDPSINSSLKFLRKTPWARAKVEALYLQDNLSDDSQSENTSSDKYRT